MIGLRAQASAAHPRDEALDAVRGVLVLVMVVYHWFNYFVEIEWDIYRYLRFVTPSFIFITGFLIPRVYVARHGAVSWRISRRLTERGLKLLLLFAALNVLAGRWRNPASTELGAWHFWQEALTTGRGSAAFGILVSIGYLLILAPAVIAITHCRAGMLWAVAALAITVSMSLRALGIVSIPGEFVAIGIAGLATGATGSAHIDSVVERVRWLVAAYGVYLLAITIWNIRYPLQVAGAGMTVLLLYGLARRAASRASWWRQLVQMGRYSLYAYVAQIVLLRALHDLTRNHIAAITLAVSFVLGLGLTALAVRVAADLRSRWDVADRVYRTIFA